MIDVTNVCSGSRSRKTRQIKGLLLKSAALGAPIFVATPRRAISNRASVSFGGSAAGRQRSFSAGAGFSW